RRNIHQVKTLRLNNREVTLKTSFYARSNKVTLVVVFSICLRNRLPVFIFSRQINNRLFHHYPAILNFPVRSFNKVQVMDLRVNTQRRNQTNIWSLRRFNRTQTSVMRIVYVTNLKTGTLT